MDISQRLSEHAMRVEQHLRQLLMHASAHTTDVKSETPGRLAAAMDKAALSGGKRLRPVLVLETASLFDVAPDRCLSAAAAIECVHCYSLVHDDLPCMDNDELRRGLPTVWKAFDEWTAVLTGDALLTFAFEILARPETHPDAEIRTALISCLARASGAAGMVYGQVMDLTASKLNMPETPTVESVTQLQSLKTGALIVAACEMGGRLGGANVTELEQLRAFGSALGLAFQIRDDLLDLEGSPEVVGKATGKDERAGKSTLVGVLGKAGAQSMLQDALNSAHAAADYFESKGAALHQIVEFVAQREH